MILVFSSIERDTARMPHPSGKEIESVVHESFKEKPGSFFPHRINLLFQSWRKHVQYGDYIKD
jgi:hypothetical protein